MRHRQAKTNQFNLKRSCSKSRIRDIENDIQKIPYIRACYHVAGRFDYLLHITAKDVNHLGELVKKEIAAIEGIGKIETFIIFSEAKVDRGWPIPNNANSEDKSNVN